VKVRASRQTLTLYGGVVGLFALILGWWMFFFSEQGAVLVDRLDEGGANLTPVQVKVVTEAADATMRMLLFEGAFLLLLLVAGVLLIVRSMRHEVVLHRQRRDFLSAVTHELKSPIASARLYIESLLLNRVPSEKRTHYLERAREDLGRLAEMTDHLLDTARTASGRRELDLEVLDLAEVVRQEVSRYTDREVDPVTLEVSARDPVYVRADRDALATILRNLFTNARKYGGESARARVIVKNGDGRAHLVVRDFGPGVPSGDPKILFGPFVRGGDELVRSRPGVGLGLYLVAELARAHGGDVEARNAKKGQGFAVDVSLPVISREEFDE